MKILIIYKHNNNIFNNNIIYYKNKLIKQMNFNKTNKEFKILQKIIKFNKMNKDSASHNIPSEIRLIYNNNNILNK